jgi:hypothetical protein
LYSIQVRSTGTTKKGTNRKPKSTTNITTMSCWTIFKDRKYNISDHWQKHTEHIVSAGGTRRVMLIEIVSMLHLYQSNSRIISVPNKAPVNGDVVLRLVMASWYGTLWSALNFCSRSILSHCFQIIAFQCRTGGYKIYLVAKFERNSKESRVLPCVLIYKSNINFI